MIARFARQALQHGRQPAQAAPRRGGFPGKLQQFAHLRGLFQQAGA
ncbi:hypothetical protein [Cupriavidus cauae]|nr:hypothetical protein [Cupriavidus cauae]